MNKKLEEAVKQHLIETGSHKYNMPSTLTFQALAFKAGAKWMNRECLEATELAARWENTSGSERWLRASDVVEEIRALVADEEREK